MVLSVRDVHVAGVVGRGARRVGETSFGGGTAITGETRFARAGDRSFLSCVEIEPSNDMVAEVCNEGDIASNRDPERRLTHPGRRSCAGSSGDGVDVPGGGVGLPRDQERDGERGRDRYRDYPGAARLSQQGA